MINRINVGQYIYVESVELNGFVLKSSYNNCYFVSDDGQVIYEHCNDDNYYEYYQIHSVNGINEYGRPDCEETYLGSVFSFIGIFEPEYFDVCDDGTVEVDTNCC